MTASDLNSASKPWPVQARTSKVVYEEFHEQVSLRRFSSLQLRFTVVVLHPDVVKSGLLNFAHLVIRQERFCLRLHWSVSNLQN